MPRPGWKHLEVVGPNGRKSLIKIREDQPAEPTQEELRNEIAGAVSLGWQTTGTPRRAGRAASFTQYELLVDLNSWNKTWLRQEDGTISRNFSVEPEPPGEDLGAIPLRRRPEIFLEAPEPPKQTEEPNPWDELDPATRRALGQIMGGR